MTNAEMEYEQLKDELNKKRLRLAKLSEPGRYYTSKAGGKHWVTDTKLSDLEAEQI